MDWQLKLISFFVYTSKHYHDFLWTFCEYQINNDDPDFSDIEVIVIYLWGIMRGHQKVKKVYTYSQDHLSARALPLPDYIGLTPASEADINVLKFRSPHLYTEKSDGSIRDYLWKELPAICSSY